MEAYAKPGLLQASSQVRALRQGVFCITLIWDI